MLALIRRVVRLATSKDGVTAIEYAILAGGIAVAILGAVLVFGSGVDGLFVRAGERLKTASGGSP